ncbi:MAG: beta-galactosidase, partial [Candidatus Hydrogenedentes bacterium]|nr:beta-galactosidase [Candidatus Hydrogenedentota bacterium]
VAPCLALVDEVLAQRLDTYVQAGGTLVLTPQSGVRTVTNLMSDKTRPGLLAGMAGITVEEVRPYHHGQTHALKFLPEALSDMACNVGTWVEVLKCGTAQPLAEYGDKPVAGKPAITVNKHGNGTVYYMGVLLPQEALIRFLGSILPSFPIKNIPEGVEVTQRRTEQGSFVFILNHSRERQEVALPGQFSEMLSGETVGPKVAIGANGVLILKAVQKQ